MRIVYHHRTRATDAQRVHILAMVNAFRQLGHDVAIASLVKTEGIQDVAKETSEAAWKQMARKIPFAYEVVQLAYNVFGIPLLLAKVLSWNADFIYERYSLFNFAGTIVARLTRRPLILEVNSPFFLEQKTDNDIRAWRFAGWAERYVCQAATRVIVVTGPLKRIMIGLGVPAERLVVMPNGVDREHMRTSDSAESRRRELGLAGKVVIGFVGWFKKWHGLEFLLEAFHQSDLKMANAALLLIGDGPAMSDLRNYVAKNDLGQSVVFAGAVAHAEVPSYLEVIDIAVQPAANEYCCPMKILEYMSLGKPVVAPKQENIEELVREGCEAELFRPKDQVDLIRALTRLAQDPVARALIGENAKNSILRRGFLWTNNAQQVIELATAR